MKYLILLLVVFSFNVSHAYLIEDHLEFLASQKSKKKWTVKDLFSPKKSKKKAPVVSVLPKNFKKNQKYEFSLGLEYGNLNLDIDGNSSRFEVYRMSFVAYARFFGLVGNFYLTETSKENHGDLSLSLRLLGTSEQTTHFSVFAGVNKTKEMDGGVNKNVNNYIWGAEAMLYLFDVLGLSYHFTQMEENSESDIALRRSGRKHELRVFLDYKYFRVFGLHRLDRLKYRNSPLLSRKEIQGVMGGVQVFF